MDTFSTFRGDDFLNNTFETEQTMTKVNAGRLSLTGGLDKISKNILKAITFVIHVP